MHRIVLLASTSLMLAVQGCSDEPSGLGGPCSGDGDCSGDLTCLADLPGGMCTSACDGDCPDGSVCVDLAGDRTCFPACASSEECRGGYSCSLGHCDLPCGTDEECPEYARCDPGSTGCQLRLDQPLGAACVDDAQCASGFCHASGDGSGFCTDRCGGSEACDGSLVCGFLVEGGSAAPRCRAPAGPAVAGDLCATGSDCASGGCVRGACVFPCADDGTCGSGALCQVDEVDVEGAPLLAEYCESPVAAGVRVVDQGLLATERGVVHAELDVPEGIVSFAVVAWTDDRVLLQPRSLVGPDDLVLIDEHGSGHIRVYDQEWVVTVLVPNTDFEGARPSPGRYGIDILARDPDGDRLIDAEIHIRVLLKVRPGGVCTDGEITLNVHLVPRVHGPLSSTNAAENPWMQDVLERLRYFFEDECAVRLGEVRYFDIDDRYATIGSEAEFHEMLASQTLDTPRASANVFFVRDLSGVAEWVAGVSGGLPGPPGLVGTVSSGVAVSPQEDADLTGDVLAHELGHFLGLWHPTEMNGMTQDPIRDTETCTFDPDDLDSMARCRTIDNIMFPVLTGIADELTEGQCFVVRGYQGV